MISPWELRKKFRENEWRHSDQWARLDIKCAYDRQANPNSKQAPGTRSKMFRFRTDGVTVLTIHFFVKPDFSLGASGKFDPKYLVVNGVGYSAL